MNNKDTAFTRICRKITSPEFIISAVGIIILSGIYIDWFINNRDKEWPGLLASFLSVALFAVLCLRFVPKLTEFFTAEDYRHDSAEIIKVSRKIYPLIFFSLLGFCFIIYLLVYIFRLPNLNGESFLGTLDFWRCLDSNQYIHIAEGWYPSEGIIDDLVCLVFLPAYPIAIKLVSFVIGDYLWSALLVSAVCFGFAGCALYKLMCFEYGHKTAVRAVKYLCLLPGSFFYAAPMSESMFLLFFILSIYFMRTDRWLIGGLCGAVTTFTRSLGLVLFGIFLLEFIKKLTDRNERQSIKKLSVRLLSVFIILTGFGAYLLINYLVSGNPLKFTEYQREHWGQNLGWFFSTAEYQTRLAIGDFLEGNPYDFTGLWIPNLIASFGSLIIMILSVKKLRASLSAGFIAYYVIAIGATWLLSAPRYLCSCLPIIMSAAVLTEKKRNALIFDALLLPMNIIYIYAFAMRWNVW